MSTENHAHAVTFYSYWSLLYAWPLVVFGPLLWFLAPPAEGDYSAWLEFLGWAFLVLITMVILTIAVDIERNVAFICIVIIGLFFFLGLWLQDAQGIYVFNPHFPDDLTVSMQPSWRLSCIPSDSTSPTPG